MTVTSSYCTLITCQVTWEQSCNAISHTKDYKSLEELKLFCRRIGEFIASMEYLTPHQRIRIIGRIKAFLSSCRGIFTATLEYLTPKNTNAWKNKSFSVVVKGNIAIVGQAIPKNADVWKNKSFSVSVYGNIAVMEQLRPKNVVLR